MVTEQRAVHDLPYEAVMLILDWMPAIESSATEDRVQGRMLQLALVCKAWEVRFVLIPAMLAERFRDDL
jgi:hypothetical protein